MWIELTYQDGTPVFINAQLILTIEHEHAQWEKRAAKMDIDPDGGAYIVFAGIPRLLVEESPEDIIQMITGKDPTKYSLP